MHKDEEEKEGEDGKGAVQPWPSPSQYHEGLSATLSLCNTWTNHMAVTTGNEQSRSYWLAPKTLLSNPCFHSSIPMSPPPSPDALRRQSVWVIGRKPELHGFTHDSQPLSHWVWLDAKLYVIHSVDFYHSWRKCECCLPVQNSLPLCQGIVSGCQGVAIQLLRVLCISLLFLGCPELFLGDN